jgi:HAD superfamily hydrolase (TIGR01459 family)
MPRTFNPMTAAAPVLLEHFSLLASDYDAVLCDVWGVVHNGIAATAEAVDALARFRTQGGTVVLISNAPRPSARVIDMLDRLGVPRSAHDAVVTSGDVTREFVAGRPGAMVYHLGPERDRPLFTGLEISFAPIEHADYVVCTGLFHDDVETPQDYRPRLDRMRHADLLMVCANPDLVVERGDRLVYCAGALAELYASLGGNVLYAGKPHRPIYDLAVEKLAIARGGTVALSRVLAIGDSVRTDLKGAAGLKLDCLFITAGIHAEELGTRNEPDLGRLVRFLAREGVKPKAVMRRLAW